MSFESIIEISFAAIFTGGLGTLVWARMNRLETQIIDIRKTTTEEFTDLRKTMATSADLHAVREDISAMRQEMAVMRSDLTHVALAIGVNRPKPAEG